MLSKKIEDMLNSQIVKEANASNDYLSKASWCEMEGLKNCAAFLYEQSEEEREHMMKLVRYVNEAGGHALAPQIKEPPHIYKNVLQVFESALEHEREVSKSINKLVDESLGTKDYITFNFLQWFVSEQLEEESLFRTVVDVAKMAGSDGRGHLLLDTEISRLRTKDAT